MCVCVRMCARVYGMLGATRACFAHTYSEHNASDSTFVGSFLLHQDLEEIVKMLDIIHGDYAHGRCA